MTSRAACTASASSVVNALSAAMEWKWRAIASCEVARRLTSAASRSRKLESMPARCITGAAPSSGSSPTRTIFGKAAVQPIAPATRFAAPRPICSSGVEIRRACDPGLLKAAKRNAGPGGPSPPGRPHATSLAARRSARPGPGGRRSSRPARQNSPVDAGRLSGGRWPGWSEGDGSSPVPTATPSPRRRVARMRRAPAPRW